MKLVKQTACLSVLILFLLMLSCSKDLPLSTIPKEDNLENSISVSLKKSSTIDGKIIEGFEVFYEKFNFDGSKGEGVVRTFTWDMFDGVFIFHAINGDGEGADAIRDVKIELNNTAVENDQHWDMEKWKRINLGFPCGQDNLGYEFAKYLDPYRIQIVNGINELEIKAKSKEIGSVTIEILFQPYPIKIIDEDFDSHDPSKPIPTELPLLICSDSKWQISTRDPANDLQGITTEDPYSAPQSYFLEKHSTGNDYLNAVLLAAWPGWLMGTEGYLELKAKPVQNDATCMFHASGQGISFRNNGKAYTMQGHYLFDYEANIWYKIRIDYNVNHSFYTVTIDGKVYGPFQSNMQYPYVEGNVFNMPFQPGKVYFDDVKAVYKNAIIWDDWMDKPNKGYVYEGPVGFGETFDTHAIGQLPIEIDGIGYWDIETKQPEYDYQEITNEDYISSPNSYIIRKTTPADGLSNSIGLIAKTGIKAVKGYQEAKVKLKQASAQFHISFIAFGTPENKLGRIWFDEFGKVHAHADGPWPNLVYLFDYEVDVWYHIKMTWDTTVDEYVITVNNIDYGPFQLDGRGIASDAQFVNWYYHMGLPFYSGTVYIDDLNVTITETVE